MSQPSNVGRSTRCIPRPPSVSEACTCIYQSGWREAAPTLNKITLPACPVHGAEVRSDSSGHKDPLGESGS